MLSTKLRERVKNRREREKTRARTYVRETDKTGHKGGKNRSEAYVETAESTCNFRQSGSQAEGQLHQTVEERKSAFSVGSRQRPAFFCSLSNAELAHA